MKFASVIHALRYALHCLVPALLVVPCAVQAQRLGDEAVLSRLGDPVEVEIAVEDWQGFDVSQLTVGVGNAEQYELFRLEYQSILNDLNFALVGPNAAGEMKVLISSREPVSEPFLELLLVLSWPSGSTLRDYVLLFDPPSTTPAVSTNAAPAPAPAPPQTRLRTVVVAPPADAEPASSPAPDQTNVRTQVAIEVDAVAEGAAASPASTTDALNVERRRYQVRTGDTLWIIARQFQPAGAAENLYQFLVSLHDLNRDAFINGNISLLQTGSDLMIPTARDVSSINPSSAQTVFEGRWADGTRVANGEAAALPPEFVALNEGPDEEAPASEPAEPELPAGTETPANENNEGLLTTASTAVIAVGVETEEVLPAEDVPAEEALPVEEEPLPQAPASNADSEAAVAIPEDLLAPSDNPYLQKVTDSAVAIKDLLETRQQRMVEVEEQLLAMRIQMQEAQVAALELNAKLREAIEQREVQRESSLRNIAFLTTLVIGLVAALVFALRKMVTMHRQIQALARFKQEARQRKAAMVEQEEKFLGEGQATVVEEVAVIEELTLAEPVPAASFNAEIERDRDKVPDIDMSSPEAVDFLVGKPAEPIEESPEAPKSSM